MNVLLASICFIGYISYLLTISQGSVILFETSTYKITPAWTPSMRMRCSVNDTASSNQPAVVGRDVTSTTSDVPYVTSIVVTHQGEHLALVTNFVAAKVTGNSTNIKVNGSITGQPGERGYIELEWLYPSSDQGGDYTCEINAVTEIGHNVVFAKTVGVDIMSPTFDDVAVRLRELEKENQHLKTNNAILSNKVKDLEVERNQTNDKIRVLESDVKTARHAESGVLNCGASSSWTRSGSWLSKSLTKNFGSSYDKPPVVTLSVHRYVGDDGDNSDYWITLDDVSNNSFRMTCKTYNNAPISAFNVAWTSIPN